MEIVNIICSVLTTVISTITLVVTCLINKTTKEIKFNELSYNFIDSFEIFRVSINKNYVSTKQINLHNIEVNANTALQLKIMFNSKLSNFVNRLVVSSIKMHIQNFGENGGLVFSDKESLYIYQEEIVTGLTMNIPVDRTKMDKLLNNDFHNKKLVYTINCILRMNGSKKDNNFIKQGCLDFSSSNRDKIIFEII